jgi:hypothetical protein
MGQAAQDFEKGDADGTADAMQILEAIVHGLLPPLPRSKPTSVA